MNEHTHASTCMCVQHSHKWKGKRDKVKHYMVDQKYYSQRSSLSHPISMAEIMILHLLAQCSVGFMAQGIMRTESILAQCKEDQYPQSNQGFPCCVQSGKGKKSFRLDGYNCVSVKDLERLTNKEEEQPEGCSELLIHCLCHCSFELNDLVHYVREILP